MIPSRQVHSKIEYNELYLGLVEYNIDPLQLGRVKVRVPALHGVSLDQKTNTVSTDFIPYISIPWASPLYLYNEDYSVPEVNSLVYVLFQQGNPELVVYLGEIGRAHV